jgi:hypothetical protein
MLLPEQPIPAEPIKTMIYLIPRFFLRMVRRGSAQIEADLNS